MKRYNAIDEVLMSLDRSCLPISVPRTPESYERYPAAEERQVRRPTVHITIHNTHVSQGFMDVLDTAMRLTSTQDVNVRLRFVECRFGTRIVGFENDDERLPYPYQLLIPPHEYRNNG